MAISKIILNGVTQMDLTADTVAASNLIAPNTAHGADGEAIVGMATAGITPSGTLNITANDTYDVTNYASAVVNVNVEGSGKNIQFYDGYDEVSTTTYSATDVSITVKKDGTYKCSWVAFRNTTSGMSGTRLYKNGSAVGSPHTEGWVRYNIMFCSETLTLEAGDVLVVRGRARSTSFIVLVGNLIIEEQ